MLKNNSEQYSREVYESTKGALNDIVGAVQQTHDGYEKLAEPHLELLAEGASGEYPLQDEFDTLVNEEEAAVAPLVAKSRELEAKLRRLHNLAWDEALETEKMRMYKEEILPQVEAFNGQIDELENEVERINELIRDARGTANKLEELLKKDHTTREEDADIAEYFATVNELIPKIMDLKHRLVHSKPYSAE